jgi:hypothetical protein
LRIDDSFSASSDLRSLQVERTQDTPLEQGRQRAEQGRQDSVALSGLGAELARGISEESPEEITRVDQARQAVAANNFSAPAEETADRILDAAVADAQVDSALQAHAAAAGPSAPE